MSKKSPIGQFDIPVQVPCPHCGNDVQIALRRVETGVGDIVCRSCAREFQLSEQERSRLLIEHGKKLEALRRSVLVGKRIED